MIYDLLLGASKGIESMLLILHAFNLRRFQMANLPNHCELLGSFQPVDVLRRRQIFQISNIAALIKSLATTNQECLYDAERASALAKTKRAVFEKSDFSTLS